MTQFDEIPCDNGWFLRNIPEAKALKQTKNGEPPASTVAKKKSANDEVLESEEEIKSSTSN